LRFHSRDVVHRAVQVHGLSRVAGPQQLPAVGGEAAGGARLTGLGQLAAGANENPGQAVDGVGLSRHG